MKGILSDLGIDANISQFQGRCIVEAPIKALGTVGDRCFIGAFSYLQSGVAIDHTSIGRFCSIAAGVVMGPGAHPIDWLSTHPFVCDPLDYVTGLSSIYPEYGKWLGSSSARNHFQKGDVVVGNDVWIGHGAIVMRGVTIGDGAIIGAGAVVTRDVEPYAIAVGNPARTIRKRFEAPVIKRLLAVRWWNYDLSSITYTIDYSNIEDALNRIENATLSGELQALRPQAYEVTARGAVLIDEYPSSAPKSA